MKKSDQTKQRLLSEAHEIAKDLNLELKAKIIMSKKLSTYERKMQDKKFKAAYEQSYKKLLMSELLISIMEEDEKSVRALAKEANLSPSVIQDIRSGKQKDIKVSNLLKIAQVFGYEVVLQKGDEKFAMHDEIINEKHHLSLVTCA